jgi:hypothetical protein
MEFPEPWTSKLSEDERTLMALEYMFENEPSYPVHTPLLSYAMEMMRKFELPTTSMLFHWRDLVRVKLCTVEELRIAVRLRPFISEHITWLDLCRKIREENTSPS